MPRTSSRVMEVAVRSSGVAVFAEGLRKRYGEARALDGFDLTVPEGSVCGLLGPNGAGKTTAVRILSTLLRPDGGRAEVAGSDVVRQAGEVRFKIGLAGQQAAVDEVLTGRHEAAVGSRRQLHPHAEGAVPGRADHGPGSPRAQRGVGVRPLARGRRDNGLAHHAVPGRGRPASRQHSRHRPRAGHRSGHARRAQVQDRGRPDRRRRARRRRAARRGGGRRPGVRGGPRDLPRRPPGQRARRRPGGHPDRGGEGVGRRGSGGRGHRAAQAHPRRGVPPPHRPPRRRDRQGGGGMKPVTPTLSRTPLDRLRWALADAWTITRRDLTHWVRQPFGIVITLLFPVMLVLMFGYLFGGAMSVPGGGNYREFLMPGMFAMTMAFGLERTMLSVSSDAAKGVTDRFRSMPMAPSAVIAGRSIADMLGSALGLAVMAACGLSIGWRWHGSMVESLLAVGLLLLLRFSLLWVGIYLGLVVESPEAVAAVQILVWPVLFLSNTFVAPETMLGWLGAISEWNPLSATVAAARELFGNPGWGGESWIAQHAPLMAVVWPLLICAVFFPPSVG